MLSSCFSTAAFSLSPRLVHSSTSIALSPRSTGAIILSGRYFNDLVWPGARLFTPQQFDCQAIYTMGEVKWCRPTSVAAHRYAQAQRMKSIQTLQRILDEPAAAKRANLIFSFLCRRFGLEAMQSVPLDAIARLVAVPVPEIAAAQDRYLSYLKQQAGQQRMSQTNFLRWQRQLYHQQTAAVPLQTFPSSPCQSA